MSVASINAYELRGSRDWPPKPRRARRPCARAHEKHSRKINTKKNHKINKKLIMENVELYQYSNKVQRRDALRCLEEYGKEIKWRNFDKVLDIGCGDGGVTSGILKKFIPDNFKHLVGCDISRRMVEFANRHYGDERTSFMVMDIEGDIPRDLMGAFDHAFSFYTLHWIVDQEAAFSNIYDLLAPGGDCLLVFLGSTPLFDVFRILSRRPKWRHYLQDVERYVSPYHDSQDPEKEINTMMAKLGFKNIDVQCKDMSFIYKTMDTCKKAVAAVNPFRIPADLEEEFLEDYMNIVRDMQLIDQHNNNLDEAVNIKNNYTLLVAFGTK